MSGFFTPRSRSRGSTGWRTRRNWRGAPRGSGACCIPPCVPGRHDEARGQALHVNGLKDSAAKDVVRTCVRSYREADGFGSLGVAIYALTITNISSNSTFLLTRFEVTNGGVVVASTMQVAFLVPHGRERGQGHYPDPITRLAPYTVSYDFGPFGSGLRCQNAAKAWQFCGGFGRT
jgi:hypothetical protein